VIDISFAADTPSSMNDYQEDLEAQYWKLKEEEWEGKLTAPKDLALLSWKADRAYLLFGLRLKARRVGYRFLFPDRDVGLRKEDFAGLENILAHRQRLVAKEPSLFAYKQTIALMEMDPYAVVTIRLIEDHLIYLESVAEDLPGEDYIDNLSFLGNYCSHYWNEEGLKTLVKPLFRSKLMMLGAKYHGSWRGKRTALSHMIFSNMATIALHLKEEQDWRFVAMPGLDLPEGRISVYDWIEAYIAGYRRKVSTEFRMLTIYYIRCRMAFSQNDFPELAVLLRKLADQPLSFYGPMRLYLSLMTYYELRYRHGSTPHPEARKLMKDPRIAIGQLRAKARDLEKRQERLKAHHIHLKTFADGYAGLLSLRMELDKLPSGSEQRRRLLEAGQREVSASLVGKTHEAYTWLRERVKELA